MVANLRGVVIGLERDLHDTVAHSKHDVTSSQALEDPDQYKLHVVRRDRTRVHLLLEAKREKHQSA